MTQYHCKCLSTEPDDLIAYWPLWEASGEVMAEDISGHDCHGVYTGVTLGQPGIGDGKTSALFDGATSFVNIYTTELNALFDGDELTMLIWNKHASEAAWSDGIFRRMINIEGDGDGEASINKSSTASLMQATLEATGSSNITKSSGGIYFVPNILVASKSGNYFRYYRSGLLVGQVAYPAGAWAADLNDTNCAIGARNLTPTQLYSGYLAHAAIWRTPLSDAQAKYLSRSW
jgi:hypothetical protein